MQDYKEELNNLDSQEPQETVRRDIDLAEGLEINLNLESKLSLMSFQEIHKEKMDMPIDNDADCFLELSTKDLMVLIEDELNGDFDESIFIDSDDNVTESEYLGELYSELE